MKEMIKECLERLVGVELEDDISLEEIGFDSIMRLVFFQELEETIEQEIPEDKVLQLDITQTIGELIEEIENMFLTDGE